MEESIHLVLRLRPPRTQKNIYWTAREAKILGEGGEYNADAVYDSQSSNQDIFEKNVSDMVKQCCVGYNTAVMAYGQSGAGKTHTLLGGSHEDGLVSYVVRQLFEEVEKQQKSTGRSYLVQLQILELYCEKIRDLLIEHSTSTDRKIMEVGKIPRVTDLKEFPVTSAKQALEIINRAQSRRVVASTELNDQSSRSHAIIQLTIESSLTTDSKSRHKCRRSVMNIVDLAGSENTGSNSGIRAKEGNNINLSLLSLGKVINQLTEKNGHTTQHVSYRDSKLTRLLKPCLGGNSNTLIVCCVDPQNKDESLRTLKFSERLKLVKAHVELNEEEEGGQLAELMGEVERLKRELADAKEAKEEEEEKRKRLQELDARFLCGTDRVQSEKPRAIRRQTICASRMLSYDLSPLPLKNRKLMPPKFPENETDPPSLAVLQIDITGRRSDSTSHHSNTASIPEDASQEVEDLRHQKLQIELESKRVAEEFSSFKKQNEELIKQLLQAEAEKTGVEAAVSALIQDRDEMIAQFEHKFNQNEQRLNKLAQEQDEHSQLISENSALKDLLADAESLAQEQSEQIHSLNGRIHQLSAMERDAEYQSRELKKWKHQAMTKEESVDHWKEQHRNAVKDLQAAGYDRDCLQKQLDKLKLDKDAEIERLERLLASERAIHESDRKNHGKVKSDMQNEVEKVKNLKIEKEMKLLATRSDLSQARREVEHYKTQFSSALEEELTPLREQNNVLNESVQRLQMELEESRLTADKLEKELQTQKAISNKATKELQCALSDPKMSVSTSEEQLKNQEKMKKQIMDLEDELETLRNEQKNRRQFVHVQPGDAEKKLSSTSNELVWTQSRLKTVTQEKEETVNLLKNTEESLKSKTETLNKGIEQYNKLLHQHKALGEKYRVLKDKRNDD